VITKPLFAAIAACLVLGLTAAASSSRFAVDLESGIVSSGYNDVRIPGDIGTEFSLSDDLDAKATAFFRARIGYALTDRSTLFLLAAPLEIEASGETPRDIYFQGETFPAGQNVDALFRFDSYRLTYRYDLYRTGKLELALGLTAKIRDAEISLSGPNAQSKKTNVGFVPLLNFSLHYNLTDRLGLLLDGDALAAPQGRAEDVLAALTYAHSDRLQLRVGYRVLEGGADNDEVYNFALLHYAAIGVTLRP
jgi:hypothetical protein